MKKECKDCRYRKFSRFDGGDVCINWESKLCGELLEENDTCECFAAHIGKEQDYDES